MFPRFLSDAACRYLISNSRMGFCLFPFWAPRGIKYRALQIFFFPFVCFFFLSSSLSEWIWKTQTYSHTHSSVRRSSLKCNKQTHERVAKPVEPSELIMSFNLARKNVSSASIYRWCHSHSQYRISKPQNGKKVFFSFFSSYSVFFSLQWTLPISEEIFSLV